MDVAADGPDAGKVQSVTFLRTVDATVFQDERGSDWATINARVPGRWRPGPPSTSRSSTASWEDELWLRTREGADKKPRKEITLTDRVRFNDIARAATLTARRMAVILLRPKASPPAPAPAGSPPAPASSAFEMEGLVALDDVHLNSPGNHLTARRAARRRVRAGAAATAPATPAPAAAPAPGPSPGWPRRGARRRDRTRGGRSAGRPARLHGHRQPRPGCARPAPSQPVPKEKVAAPGGMAASAAGTARSGTFSCGATSPSTKTPNPANPGAPTAPARRWTCTSAGRWKFLIFHRDPQQAHALAAHDAGRDQARLKTFARLARIITKEMDTQGEIIGLDQQTDQAWVTGPASSS